ncbi:hypothetical protein [Ulvibacter litoralis]|uniref:Uncharacterized protein n=1 Tax=Ulvibacter litoralis TaxID=227084 RepID=A0A1G7K562_9FLAO|nr:hypothetical protein [Ulvibacter litoralis]GHC66600.1 hypothetical protein GCM10008083_34230 [Ulvibacter litoralis]SDF32478.1 hypothetical protein SAMN05421855_1571 [Ulvibacter litoralis]
MILLVVGIKYLTDYASNIENLYWIIGTYIVVCIIFYQINRKFKNKAFDFIVQAILFPFTLLYGFVTVAIPILSTQIYLFAYLGLSFSIPMILYRIDESQLITGLKEETWIYLIITSGVIIATLLHKQVTFLTFKLIPFLARKSEKMKRFKLVELCEYIVSKNNIKLVIYSLFFIALIIFNFLGLQQSSYYENPNIDKAILQSFVTFIAFERILANLKLTEFKPSELLKSLKLSIFNETEIITDKKTTGNKELS